MLDDVILWGHALAALLFGALCVQVVRRRDMQDRGWARPALPRVLLAVALGCAALWALSVAGIDRTAFPTRLLEGARNIAWLTVMLRLQRGGDGTRRDMALAAVYGVIVLVTIGQVALYLVAAVMPPGAAVQEVATAALLLRTLSAVSALVLLHGLYPSMTAPGIRLTVAAIGAMWLIDVNVSTIAYLTSEAPDELIAARGFAMVAVGGVVALAMQRIGERPLQVSRTVAFHSLSVLALLAYLAGMAAATKLITQYGGERVRVIETAFVFGSTVAVLTLASSSWLRAWIKVKLAKHLFRHRYDYRVEWTRFTETLGQPEGAAPLDERVVKAIADLVESPAGMLLVPDGGALGTGARWRWSGADGDPAAHRPLAAHLAATGRIIELDAVRSGDAPIDADAAPAWMVALPHAWVIVPLLHLGELAGAILLARPLVDRALDWEDFDLLKVAGRQVASFLAESRAQDALSEARRFEEFNRRFAFILHDIKNLVSQLTLTARNAERHADNPAFRADMIATLKESAGRMNDLLARLSQHHRGPAQRLEPTDVAAVVARVAAVPRQHPVEIACADVPPALADAQRLEQILGHLVQNAVEASAPDQPVRLIVAARDGSVEIAIADRGQGMSPAFLRDALFKPFVSSKPGGFGIGAFEARQLAHAMSGRIEVESREGEGSVFRVLLPAAPAAMPHDATTDHGLMGRAA